MPDRGYEFANSTTDSLAFEMSDSDLSFLSNLADNHENTDNLDNSEHSDPNSDNSALSPHSPNSSNPSDRGFCEKIKLHCTSDLKMLPKLFFYVDDPLEVDDYKHYQYWRVAQSGVFKEVAGDLKELLKVQYPDPPDWDYPDQNRASDSFNSSFGSTTLDC